LPKYYSEPKVAKFEPTVDADPVPDALVRVTFQNRATTSRTTQ